MQDELSKLPSVVNESSGPVAAAGRSFDTMASKATVNNAKSTFDWVDMKGKGSSKATTASKRELEGDAAAVGAPWAALAY